MLDVVSLWRMKSSLLRYVSYSRLQEVFLSRLLLTLISHICYSGEMGA